MVTFMGAVIIQKRGVGIPKTSDIDFIGREYLVAERELKTH